MNLRIKCPKCGNVQDISVKTPCTKCGELLFPGQGGLLNLYRIGSPIGVAAGYGIYINGAPFGHLGNKQILHIPLPYGHYTLHMTCGATRKCEDLTVTLSPENQSIYAKAHIIPGFVSNKIAIEECSEADFPKD